MSGEKTMIPKPSEHGEARRSTNKRLPLRILHVTFNMGIGGTEQVIRQLVENLSGEEFICELVCIDGTVGEIGRLLTERGVEIHSLKRQPGFDWHLVHTLRRLIRSRGVDLIHCHQYTPYLYGWLASLGLGAKVIFTEHGRFHPDRHRYKAFLVNRLMALSSFALVAISSATRDALATYEFMPAKRIQVIYNGIKGLNRDCKAIAAIKVALGIPAGSFVVGTVARLDPVKNQRMMLKAYQRVLRRFPDSYLLMVGDGPERKNLEAYAVELGVEDRVIFTGFIVEPEAYLACMDLFLLSSHTEGTSMTLLEAMSLGIPSVVTGVGGNPEIVVNEETGLIVEPDNPLAFADAIVKLQSDPTLLSATARNSKKAFYRRFAVEKMLDNYSTLYRNALK